VFDATTGEYSPTGFTTASFCPPPSRVEGLNFNNARFEDAYILAFYWSIMAMLGSDVLPQTNAQYTFATLLAMVGIIVFSTVIGR
jgi:hypothetical protein